MVFLRSKATHMVGDNKPLAIEVWDEIDPTTDLSLATATIGVYSKTNTEIWAPGAAAISGTTIIKVSRTWDTTGISPAEYRAVAIVSFNGERFPYQWIVRVVPLPSPQL